MLNKNSSARCDRCGAALRPNWKFCGKCRAPLSQQGQQTYPATTPLGPAPVAPPPLPSTPAPGRNGSRMPFAQPSRPTLASSSPALTAQCPACRKEIEDDGDYCEHCGAKISATTADAERLRAARSVREPAAPEVIQGQRTQREKELSPLREQEGLARDRAASPVTQRLPIASSSAAPAGPAALSSTMSPAETPSTNQPGPSPSIFPGEASEQSSPFSSFEWGKLASPRTLIAASVAGLLLVALTVLMLSTSGPTRSAQPSAQDNTQATVNAQPATRVTLPVQAAPIAPDGMAYVPGGTFKMGRDDGAPDERPAHEVTIKPFFIDLYEVTCEQYLGFIKATGHRPPKTWAGSIYPPGSAHHPVTGVTWTDATAYADWAGKRLPAEEEWELAARGTDGRLYPWGDRWGTSDDLTTTANAFNTSAGHFVDVGTFKGVSPYGLYDMVGNAWEWTASAWSAYPGGALSRPALYKDMKVMRGNYWQANDRQATTTFRIGWPADDSEAAASYDNAGFRCAKGVTADGR